MENLQHQIQWILQEKYHGKMTAAAKKDIQRLKAGEPVDYIIGFSEFLDCKIDLSKRPLIPRVETEFWVGEAIEELKKNPKLYGVGHPTVLDMFAGSGCIGVAVLKHVPNASVVFADSEDNALEQIKINCKLNKIPAKRYKIIQSDVFDGPYYKTKRFTLWDGIFANPPYISKRQDTRYKIQDSVLHYEPHAALFGGEDGMRYIRKFLAEAKNFLAPGGKIFMEFDPPQKNQIEKIIKQYHYKNWKFHKDQYGKWRSIDIIN